VQSQAGQHALALRFPDAAIARERSLRLPGAGSSRAHGISLKLLIFGKFHFLIRTFSRDKIIAIFILIAYHVAVFNNFWYFMMV
jgi:hypothetical protein